MSQWQNRIVESGVEQADQLLANPYNFRFHPEHQQEALLAVIEQIGWIQEVIVNRTTGHIIDGHLRVTLAMRNGEAVPVKYVELSETEEKIALASIDPIAALATQDGAMLADLIEQIGATGNDALDEYLNSLLPPETDADADREEAKESLADRFLVPPFSVLDAKQGYWKDRKETWLKLGIRSEIGRGNDGDKTQQGLTYAVSSQPPHVYEFKNKIEAQRGRKLSWSEFAQEFPEEIKLIGTSVFDPVLCEVMYSWFCPEGGAILDPFAGGSVRGVVAATIGYQYTGIDLSARQIEANRANWDEINSGTTEVEHVN
jgi:hypothetical protein